MTKNNNLYGIFFMIVNSFALASLYAINKQLLREMSSSQATFLYKFTVFVCLAAWVLRKGLKGIKTPVLRLHIVRGFFSISGSLCFAYGLKHTNLANATALGYTEQLLWAIIGVMFFKEKMSGLKLCAIVASFSAMLLIIFPHLPRTTYDFVVGNYSSSTDHFNYYYLFVIAAAAFWGINSTIVKVLGTKSVRSDVQAFYGLLFQVLFAYPTAFFEWDWHRIGDSFLSYPTFAGFTNWADFSVTDAQAIKIVVLALLYFVHSFAFYLSFKYAEMSTVAPFDYSRLIFTCLLGYIMMGDVPQHTAQYVGYAIIVLSGFIIASSERSRNKPKTRKEQLETHVENV